MEPLALFETCAYLLPLPLSSREEFWDHTRGSVELWLPLMLETNRQIRGDLSNTCDHDQRNSKSCQVFNLSYCTNSFWLKAQKKIFNEAINWIYFPGHAAPRKDFEMEGFPNNSCLSFLLLRYKWDDLLCSSTNKCFQNQKRNSTQTFVHTKFISPVWVFFYCFSCWSNCRPIKTMKSGKRRESTFSQIRRTYFKESWSFLSPVTECASGKFAGQ